MPVVQETLLDPAGRPLADVQIDILLIASDQPNGNAPGYGPTTILGRWQTYTDVNGSWSVELAPNDLLDPPGTYYTLSRKTRGKSGNGSVTSEALVMLGGAGPYSVLELLVEAPTAVPSLHEAKPDPHPQYLTDAEGDAEYATIDHTHAGGGAGDPAGTAAAAVASHAALADPHPGYLTPLEGAAAFDAIGAATAGDAAHAVAADPHSQYQTAAESAAQIAVHEAAGDPHASYQKESEKGSANGYASLDSSGLVPDAQIPAAIARDAEVTTAVTTAVSDHAAAVDPHPGYETPAEVLAHPLSAFAAPIAAVALNAQRITGLADPVAGTDAVNKNTLDATAAAISWRGAVRAATTIAGTLASSFENGDTVDGVVLATGDRVLIKNQAAGAENGIYTINASGTPTRATDADSGAELAAGAAVLVNLGTVNAGSQWRQSTTGTITVDTTALVWQQFGQGTAYSAGAGLSLAGNAFSLTTPVPLASGGTAATSAAAALTSLGALPATHTSDADPHTGYQKESERNAANGYAGLDSGGLLADALIPAAIARDAEVTSAVATHAALSDPHPGYLTPTEGNAAYDASGAAASATAAHEADSTNIHGLTDTALLETLTGAQAKADAAQVAAASDATTKVATHAAADAHALYEYKQLAIAGDAIKTASYAMLAADEIVLAGDTGAAGITITLPDAVTCKGMTKRVIRTSAAFTTTIATTSGQTISGRAASNFNLASPAEVLVVLSDGANWHDAILRKLPLAPVTTAVDYTATDGCDTIIANVAAARTITLPSPSSMPLGKMFRIIKLDQSMQAVRIVSAAGELIGGQAMVAIRQFRETLQVISDGSVWHLVGRGFTQVANAHDFGARGDFQVDEQPAIQACIDYAVANNMIAFVPGGRYRLYSSLSFIGVSGLIFGGAGGQATSASESGGSGTTAYNANGTQFFWYGNQTTPMFLIEDCRSCLFENFVIQGNTAGALYVGLEICALASSQPRGALTTPTRNLFRKIHMNGTNGTGLIHGVRLPHPTNSLNAPANLVDANNDYCVFDQVEITNAVVGFSLDASQQKTHMMRGCMVVGNGTAPKQLAAVLVGSPISSADVTPANVTFNAGAVGGSFSWIGGGGAWSQIADFVIGNVGADAYEVSNADFESSRRFIAMQPITLSLNSISTWTVRANRWAHAGQIHADGKYIIWGSAGTFIFQGNAVQDASPGFPLQISVNVPTAGYLRMAIENNEIDSTAADLVSIVGGGGTVDRFQWRQAGNQGINKATSVNYRWPDYDYASIALRVAGGAVKVASYVITPQDQLVLAGDTGAAGITITLPDATICKGVTKRVIRTSASFTTTIGTTSSQTINGLAAASFNLVSQYQALEVISDGTNWLSALPVFRSAGRTIAGNATLVIPDFGSTVLVDTAAAIRTITLPTAVGIRGQRVTLKRVGANNVVLAATSAQTVDGAAASTSNLVANYAKLTVESDNANWITV